MKKWRGYIVRRKDDGTGMMTTIEVEADRKADIQPALDAKYKTGPFTKVEIVNLTEVKGEG